MRKGYEPNSTSLCSAAARARPGAGRPARADARAVPAAPRRRPPAPGVPAAALTAPRPGRLLEPENGLLHPAEELMPTPKMAPGTKLGLVAFGIVGALALGLGVTLL